jgi:hypothetical protein
MAKKPENPMPDLPYAYATLQGAIYGMAKGTSSLQERLSHAAQYMASRIRGEEFPPDLRERWRSIWKRLTATPERDGSIEATTRGLTDEEAQKIARDLCDLSLAANDRHWNP